MNQTAASSGNATSSSLGDITALLTTVHLAWIAFFAILVVIAIVYGARLKHRRVTAERQVVEHADQAGVEPRTQPLPRDARPDAAAASTAPTPPVAPATSVTAPAAVDAADGAITQLKGLGPKVAARLAELGITTVGQIAALDHDRAAALDAQLGAFSGRMERDRWIEQARFLAAGDRAGFEAVFGKL